MSPGTKPTLSRPTGKVVMLSIVLLLAAFGYVRFAGDATPADRTGGWISTEVVAPDGGNDTIVDENDIRPVTESQNKLACENLKVCELIGVDLGAASLLVGESLKPVPGSTPYLCRGVTNGFPTARYSAVLRRNSLLLYYGTLVGRGVRLPAVRRQPVVIFLPYKPDRVYLYVSFPS